MAQRVLLPSLALRVLTAVALLGVVAVHLRIAGNYSGLGRHPLALSDQFYAQAGLAFMLAAALLLRPHLLVWLATAAFAAGSLAVLVYSRYRALPVYGFDGHFQESWAVEGAKAAAWWEALSLGLALAGAGLSRARMRARG